VGTQTRGVEKMLRRIGFRYAERVDPFDGGPHFTAPTDEISLVKRTRKMKIASVLPRGKVSNKRAMIAVTLREPPFFRAVWAHFRETEENTTILEAPSAELLGLTEGADVWVLPLQESAGVGVG
jgi:arginine N-succinyltransferase